MGKNVGRCPKPLNPLEVRALARKVRSIRLSNHAKDRMRERDIFLEDIEKVFQLGDVCEPTFKKGSWKYEMQYDRHDLCCVHIVIFVFCGKTGTLIVTVTKRDYKK